MGNSDSHAAFADGVRHAAGASSIHDLYTQYKDSNSNYGWSELKTDKSPWSKGKSCINMYKYGKGQEIINLAFESDSKLLWIHFSAWYPLWINLQLPCWWPRLQAIGWWRCGWLWYCVGGHVFFGTLLRTFWKVCCLGIQWIHNGVIWRVCIYKYINRLFDMYFTCSVYRIVCLYSFG